MSTTKAVCIHSFGGAEVLSYEDLPRPVAAAGEALVRVHAASVNPVDYKMRGGMARIMFPDRPLPLVLGGDLAGVVEVVGEGVSAFKPGDRVFGMIGLMGAYAEHVALKAGSLAPMPSSFDFIQAASVPLVALTAWQALIGAAQLKPGHKLLIHGAAGGVGTFAVQIAKWKGAQVIATCSPGNFDYVRSLGADQVIDYRETPVEAMPSGLDVVLDLAGHEAGVRSMPLLARDGIVVVVNGRPQPIGPDEQNRRLLGIIVQPDGAALAQIAAGIDAGHIRSEIAKVFDLKDVAAAHTLIEQGHTRGKIVLKVGD